MKTLVVSALLLACPSAALGQFFDDFNGNALLPHWQVLQPSYLTYSVGGGMLHVEDLHTNHAAEIRASFNPLAGDFVATARLGWDAPPVGGGRNLHFGLANIFGGGLAQFGYIEPLGGQPWIQVKSGLTQPVVFPAPGPGMHEVRIARLGAQVHFFLDGTFLTALPSDIEPARTVGILFGSTFPPPNPFPDFHVDRIEIVPAPGVVAVLAYSAVWFTRRRRCS